MMSSHRKSLCSACTIGIPPHTAASYAKVTGDTASAAYVNETYEEVLTNGGVRARYKVYYMTKECRVFSMCMYIRMHDTQIWVTFISGRHVATKALLAVMTCLPAAIARVTTSCVCMCERV